MVMVLVNPVNRKEMCKRSRFESLQGHYPKLTWDDVIEIGLRWFENMRECDDEMEEEN